MPNSLRGLDLRQADALGAGDLDPRQGLGQRHRLGQRLPGGAAGAVGKDLGVQDISPHRPLAGAGHGSVTRGVRIAQSSAS